MKEAIKEAAAEVFKDLGSWHSEIVYQTALQVELGIRDIRPVRTEVPCPIFYKTQMVGIGYIDILIDNILVVELKAVARLNVRDEMQLRKYLISTSIRDGLLINFPQGNNEIEIVEIGLE